MLEKYIRKLENLDKEIKKVKPITPSYLINSLRDCYLKNKDILDYINKYGKIENTWYLDTHLKTSRNVIKSIKFENENGGF